MNEPIAVIAILSILIGLVGCFYGYPLFRLYLIIGGLFIGYALGTQVAATDQWSVRLLIGLVFAVIGAVLAFPLWSLGVALGGALLGGGLFYVLAQVIHIQGTLSYFLAIVGAIIFGVLAFQSRDLIVMLITALNGAAAVIWGAGMLLDKRQFLETGNALALISLLVLGAIGFAVQYSLFHERGQYRATAF